MCVYVFLIYLTSLQGPGMASKARAVLKLDLFDRKLIMKGTSTKQIVKKILSFAKF